MQADFREGKRPLTPRGSDSAGSGTLIWAGLPLRWPLNQWNPSFRFWLGLRVSVSLSEKWGWSFWPCLSTWVFRSKILKIKQGCGGLGVKEGALPFTSWPAHAGYQAHSSRCVQLVLKEALNDFAKEQLGSHRLRCPQGPGRFWRHMKEGPCLEWTGRGAQPGGHASQLSPDIPSSSFTKDATSLDLNKTSQF